ncbi:MAG TPA: ATP synthase subunit C [Candidatus Paceibacterota bacterium]|nr:ATP synthase subunit C [Verrucomicrobiota bacterium]HRY46445.1 ATP synthase subunit C [Candidatus Paceibacterota bacterium]
MNKTFKKGVGWLLIGGLLVASTALAAENAGPELTAEESHVYRTIGLGVAAAFAVAVSILGSGYAVGKIGSAALGAAAEKPELLIRSLLFVALAEGLAVLGFAIAMMLIQKM